MSEKQSEHHLGPGVSRKARLNLVSSRHREKVREVEANARLTTELNTQAERYLLPSVSGALETQGTTKTIQIRQKDILASATDTVKRKAIKLQNLEYGPYVFDYSRNGIHCLLAGEKGHISLFDWKNSKLVTEFHLNEHVHDVQILHDHTMFAVARKKHVYIYDSNGTELHTLKHEQLNYPRRLQYLPYHFLLVTGTQTGCISYRDTSTGSLVNIHRSGLGAINVLKQNPQNAIINVGHNNGSVTMWTPNVSKPVVKMHTHQYGPVTSMAIDDHYHMITAGKDNYVRVWDLRTYKKLREFKLHTPITSIDISAQGVVAMSSRSHVHLYRDITTQQSEYYMYEQFPSDYVHDLHFCPYEDILGVGLTKTFQHMIIPGSGAANFDSYAENPFETKKQRQEKVVKQLLEKLQPEMITLDNNIFKTMNPEEAHESRKRALRDYKDGFKHKVDLEKDRAGRKNSATKQLKRKKLGIIDEQEEEARALRAEQLEQIRLAKKQRKEAELKVNSTVDEKGQKVIRSALDRFL